jgi:hypothetical protein
MVNSGHLLENMVFMELRRFFTEIYYYRTAKNQEVDFMVIAPTREKLLFQVCESIKNEITRTRELAAIQQAMTEQQVSKSFLITLSEEKEVKLQEGTVTIIPAWRFFLEKSALTAEPYPVHQLVPGGSQQRVAEAKSFLLNFIKHNLYFWDRLTDLNLSEIQNLITDCLVTPNKLASLSSLWMIHTGKSTLTLFVCISGRSEFSRSRYSMISSP